MKKVTFGKTSLQVSQLGFGAAPIGYLATEQSRIARILNLLLDAGVNLIDTASGYPNSEAAIAKAIGHRRHEFFIVSKCGNNLPDLTGERWSADLIARTVDRSLKHLNTDRLDAMLLHSCDLATLKKGEAMGALVKAQKAGKIKFIGYSGDNEAAAYAAGLSEVAVIETSVSVADQVNIDMVLPVAQNNDIGVLAKRPIANAAWKDPAMQPGFYGKYAEPYSQRLAEMKLHPRDFGFTGPEQQAWPEFALRFTLSIPGVHSAIIGTTNPDNALANLAASEKGPLPQDVVSRVQELFHRSQADSGKTWTGQN